MKIFEVAAADDAVALARAVADKAEAEDVTIGPLLEDGRRIIRIVVRDAGQQKLLDDLGAALSGTLNWRITILPVEAMLPKESKPETAEPPHPVAAGLTREELYETITKGLGVNATFLMLVLLSTVVAAFGLYEDNTTLVIGAMLIAPLLDPSLALAFGAVVGDRRLILNAAKTNLIGLGAVLLLGVLFGLSLAPSPHSAELMARTNVGLDSVALALASGAAGALSITSGLSNVLVGVMVAVAVLPPAVALGILAGAGWLDCAAGAGTLLAVNIACVNLSAQAVFFVQGIKPRIWYDAVNARHSARINALVWTALLLLSLAVLFWQGHHVSCKA